MIEITTSHEKIEEIKSLKEYCLSRYCVSPGLKETKDYIDHIQERQIEPKHAVSEKLKNGWTIDQMTTAELTIIRKQIDKLLTNS